MKKVFLIVFVLFFFFIICSAEIVDYSHSFFGVYGKRACIMGKADGSGLEIWSYPYKILHNYKFRIIVDGLSINPYKYSQKINFSHKKFSRKFVGESWVITEEIYPSLKEPYAFLVYKITNIKDIEMIFSFKPDLSPMWPASLGGKYSYWDKKGFFVLSEAKGENFALFGPVYGKNLGNLPAHKLPGGELKFKVKFKKGSHILTNIATASKGKFNEIKESFIENKNKYEEYLDHRIKYIDSFFKKYLEIKTPEKDFNKAIKWAMLNINFAFINNPYLGEGLVAGYGLSGEMERPGFAWYFGGDGLINSYALLNYGDFKGVKKELEFLLKYQRNDGKIIHELSQGSEFINWFKDYGFPYFHGDTTLHFITLLDYYIKRTGDINFLKLHRKDIDKIFDWMIKVDSDKDGISEAKLAGTGASETGPLRQEMKTDIYLAALSCTGWKSMKNIYNILGDKIKIGLAEKRFGEALKSIDRLFWNKNLRYYSYAVKEDNSKLDEITIWPSIGMRFNIFDKQKGKLCQRIISKPGLSTDWGTRFLSSESKFYKPLSYNNGAVWPFLTGFASNALFNYENPFQGLALLKANINIINDFDFGCGTEILCGDLYIPLDQSVPNQIWSSGNTISAIVEGLLGFRTDSNKKKIELEPSIPLFWENLNIKKLKIAKGTINIDYSFNKSQIIFVFEIRNLKGYKFYFNPFIPAKNKEFYINKRKLNNIKSPVEISKNYQKIEIKIKINDYFYPYIKLRTGSGQKSQNPNIESLVLKNNCFRMTMWGKGESKIYFLTDKKINCKSSKINFKKHYIKINFPQNKWEKKIIDCSFE